MRGLERNLQFGDSLLRSRAKFMHLISDILTTLIDEYIVWVLYSVYMYVCVTKVCEFRLCICHVCIMYRMSAICKSYLFYLLSHATTVKKWEKRYRLSLKIGVRSYGILIVKENLEKNYKKENVIKKLKQ